MTHPSQAHAVRLAGEAERVFMRRGTAVLNGPVFLQQRDEAAAVAKRCCPTIEVAHMPDASHNVNTDQFDQYLPAIRGFLSRVS